MRRALICPLLAARLFAATYYVSSAGSDSNDGSADNPWLTLQQAVSSVACGDTINVVANGSYVTGDANLPYFPDCGQTTTIQSSAIAQFAPAGWRTNPVSDAPLYGKLQFTGQGIIAAPEAHGSGLNGGNYADCSIASIASSVIALGYCSVGMGNLANGSQIEFELNNEGTYNATLVPTPLTILQHYYVVNCSARCGTAGSTLQVAATPGGAPVAIAACDSNCIAATVITEPLQFTAGSATIASPDAFSYSAGTPVALGAAGFQLFGVLPEPFAVDTIYYVVNPSGTTFGLAATPGGPAITATTVGLGPSYIANTNLPHHWAFRGLELVEKPGSLIYNLFVFGTGQETSVYGMVSHMEVDHCWLHDNPGDASGPNRGIADNGTCLYVHDSYIAGMRYSEAQAIGGWGSPGPTAIVNNFLEAAGENTLYGGNWNNSGVADANKIFSGNYYYKPPVWKITQNTNAATGACWYDATDPNHSGGEWYRDVGAGQNYQCGSDGLWHTTSASLPAAFIVKDLAEHKNGRHFTYSGNLFNYVWGSAQSGEAFNNSQEYGSGPGIADDHITIQNNQITNVYQFVAMESFCDAPAYSTPTVPCTYYPSNHVYQNNLVVISLNACGVTFTTGSGTCGYHMVITGWSGYPLSSAFWNHNTIYTGDSWSHLFPQNPQAQYMSSSALLGGSAGTVKSWTQKNSIWSGDFNGDGLSGCAWPLACYFSNSTWTNNVLLNGTASLYSSPGASNIFAHAAYPTSNATINYVNPAAGDYHLAPSSPYSAQNGSATLLSDDGTDLGADIDLINMATSGAASGTPPWDQQSGLRVDPGSSQVVFRYTAPTSDACIATVYRAPARIPANQVASAGDDSGNSISDALTRELYVSGLLPSTQYWYKLACGGGVLLVGNLITMAPGQASVSFTFDWSRPTAMQYSSSRSMSSPVSLSPAARQLIPVAANSVVYVQEGVSGPITMLIAP